MKDRPLAQNNITKTKEYLPISRNFNNETYIYEKFQREGFDSLTPIQKKSVPIIARKIDTLIVAPTGSGKTEAAVIPIFTLLSKKDNHPDSLELESKGIKAIYITPLRALNNDVFRRIIKYAES